MRDIERLCRCLHRDTDLSGFLGDGSERYVLMSEERHVAMDLITDDEQVVVIAEVCQPHKRLP